MFPRPTRFIYEFLSIVSKIANARHRCIESAACLVSNGYHHFAPPIQTEVQGSARRETHVREGRKVLRRLARPQRQTQAEILRIAPRRAHV